jgi:hypothetical protein
MSPSPRYGTTTRFGLFLGKGRAKTEPLAIPDSQPHLVKLTSSQYSNKNIIDLLLLMM